MDLKAFMQRVDLDFNNIQVEPDYGGSLDYEFDINPEEFLDFAKHDIEDFEDKGTQALVNALSNSKRAIDCQVDKIFHCVGINPEGLNFPSKIEILQRIEMVAPRIIRKVIQKRNYLEHEYTCPEKEEIEDFIDIADLFIEASKRILDMFQEGFIVGDKKNMSDDEGHFIHCIYFYFDSDKKEFELRGYKEGAKIGSIKITPKDKEYLDIMKLSISVRKEIKAENTIKKFIELV
ncbi:MAG: hypothetical protein Q8N71_01060, partial [candidate division Zixibacteria bacterium]|nr:hypothetical protein [candidate division Zixibacteria bacterium]